MANIFTKQSTSSLQAPACTLSWRQQGRRAGPHWAKMVITFDKWGGDGKETECYWASSGILLMLELLASRPFNSKQPKSSVWNPQHWPVRAIQDVKQRIIPAASFLLLSGWTRYWIEVITVFPLLCKPNHIHVWLHSNQKGCVKFTFLQRDSGTYFTGFEL